MTPFGAFSEISAEGSPYQVDVSKLSESEIEEQLKYKALVINNPVMTGTPLFEIPDFPDEMKKYSQKIDKLTIDCICI